MQPRSGSWDGRRLTDMVRRTGSLKVLAIAALLLGCQPAWAECRIAVLGDSLTAGYGVEESDAFPARLGEALEQAGFDCEVIDAGVSGDTSAGGLSRLDWVLADEPTHLIVELGGNDALRGLPVDQLRSNLDSIVARAQAKGLSVFLAGMLAPTNLGAAYGDAFKQAYEIVAQRRHVPLYPFFLDGVALDPKLLQGDGIHPNAEGVEVIIQRIVPAIEKWLLKTGVLATEG
jgi:acyl-CoA thioesterase-1